MMQLSMMEEVRDKASRLIPTPYMEIVEECTNPSLSIPSYDHVMFLCETANSKPGEITDVVRALKRRISDENPAVRHLLIQLLDAMVKNCGTAFHVEIANQKALLRDIEKIAAEPPLSARGMQAKESALALALNLSIWFAGHPETACHILTTLAGDIRAVAGPQAFDGIHPDATVRVRVTVPPRTLPKYPVGAGPRQARPMDRGRVTAIPVKLPTPDTLTGMLDTCTTFAEYLNNAELLDDGTVKPDDIIVGFSEKVQKDYEYVSLLLRSNLPLERDVVQAVAESQRAALDSLAKPRGPASESHLAALRDAAPPPVEHTAIPSQRQDSSQLDSAVASRTDSAAPAGVPPAATSVLNRQKPVSQASPPLAQAPPPQVPSADLDDLFGPPAPPAVAYQSSKTPPKPTNTFVDPFANMPTAAVPAVSTPSPAAPPPAAESPSATKPAEERLHDADLPEASVMVDREQSYSQRPPAPDTAAPAAADADERVVPETQAAQTATLGGQREDPAEVSAREFGEEADEPVVPETKAEASVQLDNDIDNFLAVPAAPQARAMEEAADEPMVPEKQESNAVELQRGIAEGEAAAPVEREMNESAVPPPVTLENDDDFDAFLSGK